MSDALNCRQVAAELGMSEDTFRRRMYAMIETHCFPKPLPHGGPFMWDPIHVAAWKDRGLTPRQRLFVCAMRAAEAAAAEALAAAGEDPDAADRAKLDARFHKEQPA